MLHALGEAFPADPCGGEESAAELRAPAAAALCAQVVAAVQRELPTLAPAGVLDAIDRGGYAGGPDAARFWTLDPIDGTKGFLRNDQYAVALSLVVDGQPALGVLGCPNLPLSLADPRSPRGCLFVAVAGQGCVMVALDDPAAVEVPVRVSGTVAPADAPVVESLEAGHTAHDISSAIQGALGIARPPVRMDSQAKYGALARGDGDIYLRLPKFDGRYPWVYTSGH